MRNADLLAAATRVIPGGSLTRSKRAFKRFAEWGDGAVLYDVEGRAYIDCACALGAITLGYRPPSQHAGVFSFPHRLEVEAAEAVLQHVAPWASWARFLKTGSEATHAAYRIAKAATGRGYVFRFSGAFHGWHEWCDGDPTGGTYGWRLANFKHDVAAVFVEPARFDTTDVAWLRHLRDWCDHHGSLLIFDSMIWGARYALCGASGYYGVQPDLECFGKGYANGQAISFVVGTDRTRDHGEIPSGTFSGETSGLAVVIDTLKVYTTEPVIDTLWARGRQLQDGLREIVPATLGVCEGDPVFQRIRFLNPDHGQQFCDAMLDHGVVWQPYSIVGMPMYALTAAQVDQVLEAAKASLAVLR